MGYTITNWGILQPTGVYYNWHSNWGIPQLARQLDLKGKGLKRKWLEALTSLGIPKKLKILQLQYTPKVQLEGKR